MKVLLLTALLAGTFAGVAGADPLVCNEPWQPPSHPPVHPAPCHTPPHNPVPGGPQGRKCGFNSTTDVTREAGWQVGAISAGPLVTAEDGTLVCSVHVNNNDHAGPSVAEVSGTADPVAATAVVIEPREISYPATAADSVSLCTTWVGASETLYWHGGNATTGDQGHWDTNPSNCGEALTLEPNDPECSIWLAIDQRAGTNIAEIWQDCEPYDPII